MHISGNFVVSKSLIADNIIGIRYGAWNTGVTVKDTLIIANTDDAKLRKQKSCPITNVGIRPSFNVNPNDGGQIRLKNVTFAEFTCGKKTIQPYYDSRLWAKGMGDPLKSIDVSIVNSGQNSKPYFECGLAYSEDAFMEDNNGVLGPNGSGKGFMIKSNNKVKAFLPEGQCKTLQYGGKCSKFCENVCLRMVRISPSTDTDIISQLILTDGTRTQSYTANEYGSFFLVLPSGQFHGHFIDNAGNAILPINVGVKVYKAPLCNDYVKSSSFTFSMLQPFEVVKFRSIHQRFIFAKASGSKGLRLDENPTSDTSISLLLLDGGCGNDAHKDLSGTNCFAMVVMGAQSRRFFAGRNGKWTDGVGTVAQGNTLYQDQRWYFEDADCLDGVEAGAICVYIRNARSGRSLYDQSGKIFGASPAGDVIDNPYITGSKYKWEMIPV